MSPMKHFNAIWFFIFMAFCLPDNALQGQGQWLIPSDEPHKKRIWWGAGLGSATYATFTISLSETWYSGHERSSFHLFNDWGEWHHLDKYGHLYNAYFQSRLVFNGARWAGLDDKKSIWVGIGTSMLFQTTVEVLDGFSDKWGFSLSDMGANVAGAALFSLQQSFWKDQRILVKMSAFPVDYSTAPILSQSGTATSLQQRAHDLYGNTFGTVVLKDYNAQTFWLSINPRSFFPDQAWLPKWLNIAGGIGAHNLYGGYDNHWARDGENFFTDLPRYDQYYLSLDVDLTRIPVKSPWLKTLFSVLNIIKIPFPAIEYNPQQGLVGHWVFF